jgi:hypothetical protein
MTMLANASANPPKRRRTLPKQRWCQRAHAKARVAARLASIAARATSNAVTQMRHSTGACVSVDVVTSRSNVLAVWILDTHVARACNSRGRVRPIAFRDTSNRVRRSTQAIAWGASMLAVLAV